MINVIVDELTPCLKDALSGDFVETEVVRIERKSFLRKFNVKTQWYVNWENLLEENEIYALVIKGTVDIQGLIAVCRNDNYKTAFIQWMVASPANNKVINDSIKYYGVGGHLFAIACQKSMEYGYGGAVSGYAANYKLAEHYAYAFNAEIIKQHWELKPLIFIDEQNASRIIETYDFEWTSAAI